jgi:hypothetical protein
MTHRLGFSVRLVTNTTRSHLGCAIRRDNAPHEYLIALSLLAASQVFAQSGADPRIERLEQSIKALEGRVSSLEAQLAERPPAASQAVPANAKWRKLKNGMTESEVEQLLGSPERVASMSIGVLWDYPSAGSVSFGKSHTVIAWSEPMR